MLLVLKQQCYVNQLFLWLLSGVGLNYLNYSTGIPLSILDDHPSLDLAIDGADEVDPDLNLVKGRGGALLREKMVEAASAKFVVVADDTKLVTGLGGSGLAMPVEVVQFCWKYNLIRLQELFKEEGVEAKLRLSEGGKPYVTDNSNYIVDLYFKTPIRDALAAGKEISTLEGVVEHGLFLNMATAVIIAGKNGVEVKNKWDFVAFDCLRFYVTVVVQYIYTLMILGLLLPLLDG